MVSAIAEKATRVQTLRHTLRWCSSSWTLMLGPRAWGLFISSSAILAAISRARSRARPALSEPLMFTQAAKRGTARQHLAATAVLTDLAARMALRVQRSSSSEEVAGRREQASRARAQAERSISLP